MRDITVADLLEALERIGADPSTTTIRVNGAALAGDVLDVFREGGPAVVDLLQPMNEAETLRDDAAYEAWRTEQTPRPAKLTARQRGQMADYLSEVLG